MPTFERIPKTQSRSEFPIGEVEPERLMLAHEKLHEFMTCEDNEERYEMLEEFRHKELSDWYIEQHQVHNHAAVMSLGSVWGHRKVPLDAAYGAQQFYAGFGGTLAIIRYADLTPTDFCDFSAQITEMEQYKQSDIDHFSRESMYHLRKTHFNLHSVLWPLSETIASTYGVHEDEQSKILLHAGVGLAYLMTTATQMEHAYRQELRSNARIRRHLAIFALETRDDEWGS